MKTAPGSQLTIVANESIETNDLGGFMPCLAICMFEILMTT